MSRTPTPDELRQVYAELKRQGLSRYDYDELLRIDSQGRLIATVDAADASRAACQAIRDQFKQLASFLIVAVNHKITGDNWLLKSLPKLNGPYIWALYLEIDDDSYHEDLFLDGYDAVSKHIPYLDEILRVAHLNGVDVSRQNVHVDIRGKLSSGVNECDGGAASGDAGGASAGGDAGVVAIDAGDTAGEMVGTSTTDVLGAFDPKKGVMGVGNFMVPSKVKVPLHRWEVCNGGSKRKKDKKGRDKKYAYEKGMKVVVSMFEKDGAEQSGAKLDQSKVLSHLKKISKGVKSMDDVKAVEAKIEKEKSKIESRLSKSSYSLIKLMFTDFYAFIKDICTGKYKASWFAVTMVTVGLIYIISPIDLIPDVVPVVGVIDDAFVLKLIYDAVKDEIGNWKSLKTMNINRASMH